MNILKYEKSQYHDLFNQNDEKLELFNILKENINEIKIQIDLKKEYSNICFKVEKKILIKDLIKANRSKFSKDTVNSFSDFGIYFLCNIAVYKSRCCPM